MRFSTVAAVIGYSSLALAQTQLLPQCAQSCIGSDFGGCGTLDVQCICDNKTLISDLACCVSTGCDAADQKTVIEFAQNLCKPQGVTDLPTSATCASGASSSATGSASSTGASSAASSAASATGSAASSASSVASSASSAASSAASAAATATGGAAVCQGSAAGMGFGLVLAGLMGAL